MRKDLLFLLILALVIVILIAVLLWPTNEVGNNGKQGANNNQQNPITSQQKTEGIQVNSPTANQEVSSPLKITGSVNNGGWAGFEGQVGTVKLLDYKGNKLAEGVLGATTEWTKIPTSFESTLTFESKIPGPVTLIFSNENPACTASLFAKMFSASGSAYNVPASGKEK